MNKSKVRIIAFYLPQFHPIPENNIWWGNGFTEWTNVGKAKKFFPNHYQPRIPEELGYYDLRVEETRIHQANIAKEHGIEGFCYWHYWFGNGKRLLERPLKEVLESGKPNFPFCVAWANESWKGFSHGLNKEREVLIEQSYLGVEDYQNHFYELLPYFRDERYIKIENKTVFFIYKPFDIPDITTFFRIWNELANKNDISEFAFIANCNDKEQYLQLIEMGFDYVNLNRIFDYRKNISFYQKIQSKLFNTIFGIPNVFKYRNAIKYFTGHEDSSENVLPTIIPGWDHTPRSGKNGLVYHNSTPRLFQIHIKSVLEKIKNKKNKIVFLKSWNEWAEGNYVEPDLRWGSGYLNAIKEEVDSFNK